MVLHKLHNLFVTVRLERKTYTNVCWWLSGQEHVTLGIYNYYINTDFFTQMNCGVLVSLKKMYNCQQVYQFI